MKLPHHFQPATKTKSGDGQGNPVLSFDPRTWVDYEQMKKSDFGLSTAILPGLQVIRYSEHSDVGGGESSG